MYTPSFYVIVFNRIHIFPSKLQVLSKSKAMDVYFGCSSQNISLSAKLFSFIFGEKLHCNSVDIIELLVLKTNEDLLEAVILESG